MHIAVIPARKGSKGLPFKNRFFFDKTADFIDKESWFDRVIVSSNDEVVLKKAKDRDYEVHIRSEELAGDDVSIKKVFLAIIADLKNIPDDSFLWLFYLPNLYKDPLDFRKARQIIEAGDVVSICGFIPAKTHPFNCYMYDEQTGRIKQYIKNNVYRRQDLPPAWMLHHYICCLRASEFGSLNDELINNNTYPFFLGEETAKNLMEIDSNEDYEMWKCLVKNGVIKA